jgi:hypothetical protein
MKTKNLFNKEPTILPTTTRSVNQQKTKVVFNVTTLDEVVGCTNYVGKSHSVADMHVTIVKQL